MHGAASPQSRAAAAERLLALLTPALAALKASLRNADPRVRLSAARDILTRCGLDGGALNEDVIPRATVQAFCDGVVRAILGVVADASLRRQLATALRGVAVRSRLEPTAETEQQQVM